MADDDTEEKPSTEEAGTPEAGVPKESGPKASEESPEESSENAPENGQKDSDELDLDDDLADALSENEGEGGAVDVEKVDEIIAEEDPEFAEKMKEISPKDFEGVVIDKGAAADEVDENKKVPSAFKAFLQNLPRDIKNRYFIASMVIAIMIPLSVLTLMGKILPRFDLPYVFSMDEISKDIYTYPTDGPLVPLFDEYRVKSHTYTFPETTINLRTRDGGAAYGKFQFFLNLRDKEDMKQIESRQSAIIDMLQRVLEQVTWEEAQTPLGKEKVKKIIRHRINEFLQSNIIIGVYYRSVLLER